MADTESKVTQGMIRSANRTAAGLRQLAVKIARSEGICRICLKKPTMPLRLAFGREYACEKCLEGRERI